ncbi:uncharacterized protein BT62DRAFT_926580 [Guyanagaster necrorhizus]|uniref:Small ribosomal subunit protein mS23 n=1 Tax=Guyanagaster necrorhizus TaxID=856835 RepID=A0A9P8AZW9_9AGAR|nr:uncharacterized protein BT62DRAFT_926580 [Guyanagaster necrorhizus MCA 3950]KAG7452392.1 hypothetical protein BT62DRAFT_926580 [Guyanagaster necrorhizus MCA 3950]
MVRRIASQVHQQALRLLKGNLIDQPVWLGSVLQYPPLPLPPKAPPPRSTFDMASPKSTRLAGTVEKLRPPKNRPSSIVYIEDEVRRRFFRDHPFEAFRPVTLTEREAIRQLHPVQGRDWRRLRQWGRNPSPDDAIRFAVNLYEHHNLPLTFAYTRAVAQFRALRSEHQVARRFAVLEVESYGRVFKTSQVQLGFEKEKKALDTWEEASSVDAGEFAARKRWRSIAANFAGGAQEWTRGEQYTALWRKGVRPTYAPALTEVKYPPMLAQLPEAAAHIGAPQPAGAGQTPTSAARPQPVYNRTA